MKSNIYFVLQLSVTGTWILSKIKDGYSDVNNLIQIVSMINALFGKNCVLSDFQEFDERMNTCRK